MKPMRGLHTYLFGTPGAPEVLALHGLTGHGRRWEALGNDQLSDTRLIAPDLRGHGRSPWSPPWGLDTHVSDLIRVLDEHATGPVVVVAHSYGGAIALHLARAVPDRIRGIVLLDPAIGLDPENMGRIAELTVAHPDYTDIAEARSEKVHNSWADVPTEALDVDLAEHLVELKGGRVGWRMSIPAVVASFGELARDFVLPPAGTPTVLVQGLRVQPPYVTPEFRAALAEHLGDYLTIVDLDCGHMVAHARPDDVATLVRTLL
ncbi:alpha/beta hydrolase [Rhodococcus xishaensis]|uniref:Alpha/beta hydrolase n=2 Tax=Rhodococcus xishaensis TaxID=2487364 RepID=A0A438B3E6_9NOCA|nr:alpha/beta hydrolase [Rhodococcus xishaensis]